MNEPVGAESVAERPPRSRAVTWLGFFTVAAIVSGFVYSALREKPALVPEGLLGVQFGASASELKSILPEVREQGSALAGRALLFDEPASCRFELDPALHRIACDLDPAKDPGEHEQKKRKLLATLRELYDDETEWKHDGSGSEQWIWSGARARLSLTATSPDRLRVQNERVR